MYSFGGEDIVLFNDVVLVEKNESFVSEFELMDPGPNNNEVINELHLKMRDDLILNHDVKKLKLIAVLRSGLIPALIQQELIYKATGIKVQIAAISPNFIEGSLEKKIVNFCENAEPVFIDGWVSQGVTYQIVEKYIKKILLHPIDFYALVSNWESKKFISLKTFSHADLLLPFSLLTTEITGLIETQFCPETEVATILYEENLKKMFEDKLKDYVKKLISESNKHSPSQEYSSKEEEFQEPCVKITGSHKIGINECVKAISKKNAKVIYIPIESPYAALIEGLVAQQNVKIIYVPNVLATAYIVTERIK